MSNKKYCVSIYDGQLVGYYITTTPKNLIDVPLNNTPPTPPNTPIKYTSFSENSTLLKHKIKNKFICCFN